MVVSLPLPKQIISVFPEEMVSFLLWFAFWSFAGLLTVPWLFCVYYLVTHQLGRTKRIKQLLDEDSAPKVVIVMPCFKEEIDVLVTAINSVVECDYPPSCIHVFLSFDGDQEDELYLNTIKKLGVPLTMESYPKSIDVAYKDARITVSRFPHGGKRNCQKATFKLIDKVYSEYLKRNDNLFILFIDSDCILDRHCLQNFLYDMEFSPGNKRNMLAMTGVITSTTKKHSIITLLQDMEYIHGQLFERTVESGCGSVTCLPGALTMLRFSAFRRMAKYYFADKAETCEDLFDFAKDHLGEDRYLTHLFMIGAKQRYQIQMCTSAFCKTEAVQTYKSLVKQRRRWFLGFITNEACMLTDWRLWQRYPVLVAYRFCQNTIRTTAMLFFIMVIALLSTEKTINDLPVGFIGVSLGLNWLLMVYFGAKLRRYKIWLYPMMFVLNPFFNWYYMVYGIFTAGQRTWGGPRADAGAADKNTTVQEAIEYAEQTGDELNVVPETFIPAVIAQKQQGEVANMSADTAGINRRVSRRMTRSRRDGLARQHSVLQPPPQVEGLFAAPERTPGGFYKYLDPVDESSGSGYLSSTTGGESSNNNYYYNNNSTNNDSQAGTRTRTAALTGVTVADIEMRESDESTRTLSQRSLGGDKGKSVQQQTYVEPYKDLPDSPPYVPSRAPSMDDGRSSFTRPRMSLEDRRKYEIASFMQQQQQQNARLQQPQGSNRSSYDHYVRPQDSGSSGGSNTVPMREAGYAETLPGTPVNGTGATSSMVDLRGERGGVSSEGAVLDEQPTQWEAGQRLMPPSRDDRGRGQRSRRSPLGREQVEGDDLNQADQP